jgi:hypothetical protein
MSSPRNPTVHVPVAAELESVFHTTTRCPRLPPATEATTRSAARRAGLAECPRCFETRMRRMERERAAASAEPSPDARAPDAAESADASVSGFSNFAVE